MKNALLLAALILSFACSQPNKDWVGEWDAKWETDSAAFEGIEGISDYTMPGKFIFTSDLVNIKAYGFEGCVFSKDTLDHELGWKVSGDSLILINDEDTPGMVYSIVEKGASSIRLKLMEDIFLTLQK